MSVAEVAVQIEPKVVLKDTARQPVKKLCIKKIASAI